MILQNVTDVDLKVDKSLFAEIIVEYDCGGTVRLPGCKLQIKQRVNNRVLFSQKFKTIKEAWNQIDLINTVGIYNVYRRLHDSQNEYYYIANQNDIYCDDDGNTYTFDTYEEAEETCNILNEEKFSGGI